MSDNPLPLRLHFDFDSEGEPPSVFAANERGMCFLEIFDEPTCLTGEFSWEPEDWIPGDWTMQVINAVNSYAELVEACKALVELAKQQEIELDAEFGSGQTRDDFDKENGWAKEILNAITAIAKAEGRQPAKE